MYVHTYYMAKTIKLSKFVALCLKEKLWFAHPLANAQCSKIRKMVQLQMWVFNVSGNIFLERENVFASTSGVASFEKFSKNVDFSLSKNVDFSLWGNRATTWIHIMEKKVRPNSRKSHIVQEGGVILDKYWPKKPSHYSLC